MVAAGATKAMIDDFDFEDGLALDGVIGDLRLAADRPAGARSRPLGSPLDRLRVEPMRVDANPAGLRFSEDMVAGAESQLDNLASRFLDENVDHYTRDVGNTGTQSAAPQEVEQAIYRLSETARGRQMLNYSRDKNLRQTIIYDPTSNEPEEVDPDDSRMRYNPAMVRRSRAAEAIDEDQHETADFNTVMAHAFGHTEIGRRAFDLPKIERPPTPIFQTKNSLETVIHGRPQDKPEPEWRRLEEARATRDFENAYRRSVGKPLRTSYFRKGDVYPLGLVK